MTGFDTNAVRAGYFDSAANQLSTSFTTITSFHDLPPMIVLEY